MANAGDPGDSRRKGGRPNDSSAVERTPRWRNGMSGFRSYQPALPGHLIRALWERKQATRRPMTVLLREAVEQYLQNEDPDVVETPGPQSIPTQSGRRST